MTNRTYTGTIVMVTEKYAKIEYTARGKKRNCVVWSNYRDVETGQGAKVTTENIGCTVEFDDMNMRIKNVI